MTKRIASLFAVMILPASMAIAAGPKDYQVTGPVLEVTNEVITVEKGKERWEIARNKDTKITGELKKGSKVTIEYKMTATSVEVKDAGKPKDAGKAKPDAKSDAKPKAK